MSVSYWMTTWYVTPVILICQHGNVCVIDVHRAPRSNENWYDLTDCGFLFSVLLCLKSDFEEFDRLSVFNLLLIFIDNLVILMVNSENYSKISRQLLFTRAAVSRLSY